MSRMVVILTWLRLRTPLLMFGTVQQALQGNSGPDLRNLKTPCNKGLEKRCDIVLFDWNEVVKSLYLDECDCVVFSLIIIVDLVCMWFWPFVVFEWFDQMSSILFEIVCCFPWWNLPLLHALNSIESCVFSLHIVLAHQSHMFENLALLCRVTVHVQLSCSATKLTFIHGRIYQSDWSALSDQSWTKNKIDIVHWRTKNNIVGYPSWKKRWIKSIMN